MVAVLYPCGPSPFHRCVAWCCTTAQGGLTLAQVLSILRQVVAGLQHLHSLGILHRDLRAANLLIASLDPFHVVVTDLGLSHLRSSFAAGVTAVGQTASGVLSFLRGAASRGPLQVRALLVVRCALWVVRQEGPYRCSLVLACLRIHTCLDRGFLPHSVIVCSFIVVWLHVRPQQTECVWWLRLPFAFTLLQWLAPEVCAATDVSATPATTASDVYMVGGLVYELLTGGRIPFHWLSTMTEVLFARRASAGPVRVPGTREKRCRGECKLMTRQTVKCFWRI
jgi:serine/threonine protein kinase